jgi:hypothetical protein
MRFAKYLGRFVEPLGLTLDTLFAIAGPAPVGGPPVGTIIGSFGSVSISPAPCPIPLSSLGNGQIRRRRLRFMPRVHFAPASSGACSGVIVGILGVPGKGIKGSGRAIASDLAIRFPQRLLLIAKIATHAAVEALGALSTKTFAGFYCAPAFVVLIVFSAAASSVGRAQTVSIRFAISVAQGETTGRIGVFGWLFAIQRLAAAAG